MSVSPLRGGPAREAELLGAVLDVLRETGYAGLTVDAVVKRAHASKQTVYRRWPSKPDLVAAAFVSAATIAAQPPDTGNLRDDLLALLDSLVHELSELGDVIADLIGELRRDSSLATVLRTNYIDVRARSIQEVFARAGARGELADEVDVDLLWQLAPSTIFFRALLSDEPFDRTVVQRLVDQVILPLAQRSSRR